MLILLTHNETPSWKDYDPEEGSDDYLYIPSVEDVEQHIQSIDERQAEMTAYVAEKAGKTAEEYGTWSLRTEGVWYKYSKLVKENGEFGEMYCFAANGVRPVMWLDIS